MRIYLVILLIIMNVYLLIKLFNIRNSIKEIIKTINKKTKIDTNNVITTSTSDKLVNNLIKTLNKDLKKLRKQELIYQNGNRDLQKAITNISHDLRTPLTSIKAYLDLIDKNNLTTKQKEYLKIMDSKIKDLTELTENLFDYLKYRDLPKEIELENICLNEVLESTIISFYSLFKEHKITPKIDICQEKVYKMLNLNMLKRIFENIISNAIKYSEKDFKVKMDNKGVIEFSNKTSEIDKTVLEKIFDRYYTVRNAKKASGIGLSIAKQLVELSKGEIEAKYKDNNLIIRVKF